VIYTVVLHGIARGVPSPRLPTCVLLPISDGDPSTGPQSVQRLAEVRIALEELPLVARQVSFHPPLALAVVRPPSWIDLLNSGLSDRNPEVIIKSRSDVIHTAVSKIIKYEQRYLIGELGFHVSIDV